MYRSVLAIACLASAMLAPCGPDAAQDEPPLRLLVQIDGKDHECVDGQQVQLEVNGKPVAVKVSVQPLRHFDAEGLSFDYPRDMAFDLDASEDGSTWTLDGNDCVLLIVIAQSGDPRELAKEFITDWSHRLDPDAPEPKSRDISLAGRVHPSLHTRIQLAGSQLALTAIGIEANGKIAVITVQDSLDDEQKPSAESLRVMELLRTTLRIAK